MSVTDGDSWWTNRLAGVGFFWTVAGAGNVALRMVFSEKLGGVPVWVGFTLVGVVVLLVGLGRHRART